METFVIFSSNAGFFSGARVGGEESTSFYFLLFVEPGNKKKKILDSDLVAGPNSNSYWRPSAMGMSDYVSKLQAGHL